MSPMTFTVIVSLTVVSIVLFHLPKMAAKFKISVFIWTLSTFKLTSTISIISETV